jgi:nicotinamidase-related amidase
MLNKKFLFYKLNIVFSVAVLSLIVISLNAYASGKEKVNSANAKVVVATAKTPPMNDGLPLLGFEIDPERTALVITDPQNDFLSPKGVAWGVVGKNVTENGVVKHLEDLFKVADKTGLPVFISPHYYFPYDNRWKFEGTLEKLMHNIHMFERAGSLDLTNFDKSGADWLKQYKPYINNGKTVVTSPHKVYGPETNDLVLQLRKAGIDKIILAGMSANLCTESHMRELIEQGFEVMVVTDATGAAVTEHYDGYAAALTNFRFIASNIDNTENTVKMIEAAYGK